MAVEDLIPLNERTKEEQKEITTKGGIASGIARRRKKTLREELLLLLEENETQKNISTAVIKKALSGDTKAFEIIRDTIGEKPVEVQETSITDFRIVLGDEDGNDRHTESETDI